MRYNVVFGTAIVTALLSGAATAIEQQESLDQITVTAARTALPIESAGSAITIIDRAEIERRQARYVTDLLRAVPGFAVSQAGGAGSQTQVRVRGAEANHVLVLIDGVRANDPAAGDEFRWEYLTTGNVERIEVVRGPQSALWGSDAVAAVVQVITRSGGDDRALGGYVEGGAENTLNGSFHGNVGGERWSVGFSVERLSTDGFNISRNGNEQDGADIDSASLSMALDATDTVSIEFGLRSVDAYSEFDAVDFFTTGLPEDTDVATDIRQNYARLGVSIGAEEQRLRHHLRARYYDSDNRDLVSGAEASSAGSDRVAVAYQADIRLGKNLLAVALEHERTGFEQRGQTLFGSLDQDQSMDVSSAVTDLQLYSGESLSWLLSARFDDNSDFEDALTGRVSMAWALGDDTRLRANVGTGRKNPTFIERFGFFPGQFIGNPELKPEQSTSYEIGIDFRAFDAADVQLTVFLQDLENEINGFVFDPDTFLATAENMPGSSTRRGAEVAASWSPASNIRLAASYTYTDSSEQDFLGNDVRELRRPRHAGSVHASYVFGQEQSTITLAADYNGTRSDIFFPPFPEPSQIVTLGNYWLVDLAGRHSLSRNVTLFARLSNLLDSEYEQVYGYRTQGRSAFAGVELRFGN